VKKYKIKRMAATLVLLLIGFAVGWDVGAWRAPVVRTVIRFVQPLPTPSCPVIKSAATPAKHAHRHHRHHHWRAVACVNPPGSAPAVSPR
jgi:hypothetical protein